MQFKKIAAIAGSALMAGLTLAGAALATPTTVSEVGKISDMLTADSQPWFVVGEAAKTADVAGAINIALKLAGGSYVESAVTTTAAGETVTDGVKLATVGDALEPWEIAQSVKGILTDSDLSILADGSFTPTGASASTYKQYLYMGGESTVSTLANTMHIEFSTPAVAGETAPRISFLLPNGKTVYEYKLSFTTPVSLSTVTTQPTLNTLLVGTTLKMLGQDFVITAATWTANTDDNKLTDITVMGGKDVVSVQNPAGETTSIDVDIGGKTYTVEFSGVSTSGNVDYATFKITVDGESKSYTLSQGGTDTTPDGLSLGVVGIYKTTFAGGVETLKVAIGGDKIKMPMSSSYSSVTKGGTTVSGLETKSTDTATSWSVIMIRYQPLNSKYLRLGEEISDPFSDAFTIKFNSIEPDFDDTVNRQTISFIPSGYNVKLTYKNAVGNEEVFYPLYTADGTTYYWAQAVGLSGTTDNTRRDVAFDEAQNISAYESDYFVIQKNGFSHVMQFTTADFANNKMIFVDEKGASYEVLNTSATQGKLIVDGNTYEIYIADEAKKIIHVDLNGNTKFAGGSGAVNLQAGVEYSFVVPKLIRKGKGGLYFYKGNNTVTSTAAGVYPEIGTIGLRITNDTMASVKLSYYDWDATTPVWVNKTAITMGANGVYKNETYEIDNIDYVVTCLNNSANYECNVALGPKVTAEGTAPTTASNTILGSQMLTDTRGFVLGEEAQEGAVTYKWLYLPVTWYSTGNYPYVTTPVSDDIRYWSSVVSASQERQGMTKYGTKVSYYTATGGGSAEISYPDTFLYGNVYVLEPEGTITTGAAAGEITTKTPVAITTDIVKLDTEVTEADKMGATARDFVIVGGPCVNRLAAELLNVTYPACGAASTIPENKAIIKLVTDAFTDGKTALLVAGWEAADSDLAARVVQDGTKLAGNTASSVTISGTSLTDVVVE